MDLPRPVAAVAALSLIAVFTAGCGDNPTPVPAAGRTISVKLSEYRITPERVTAPAGRLRIVARDTGRLTHNLVVESIVKDPQDTPVQLGHVATLHPGQTDAAWISLKPGRYRMICTISNHGVLGQYGTLIVK